MNFIWSSSRARRRELDIGRERRAEREHGEERADHRLCDAPFSHGCFASLSVFDQILLYPLYEMLDLRAI